MSASEEPGSIPSSGLTKKFIGSAVPQNTRPTPMPAENSIANHAALLYSGFEPSGPRRISLYLLKKPIHTQKPTNMVIVRQYSHAKLVLRKLMLPCAASVKDAGKAIPHTQISKVKVMDIINTRFFFSFILITFVALCAAFRQSPH